MDSLTQTNLQTEALIARFRAERSTRTTGADGARAHTGQTSVDRVDLADRVYLVDRVEISAASTSVTATGVLNDSVVEQINKMIQEAGIDLRIETDGSFDVSPGATARRIADFATGYLDAYSESRAAEPTEVRIEGFMSLIRTAIKEGFSQAKDFLSGIAKLSETLTETIDQTFELTSGYLSDFESAQLEAARRRDADSAADETQTGGEL